MGIFDSFSKGFNEGRERARKEAYRRRDFPVKLVEPSTGGIVELQVIEPDDAVAKMYMGQLEAYAKALEQYGVQWNINGKRIRLTFTDGNMAENARKTWKKWFSPKAVNRPKVLFTAFLYNVSSHIKFL